MQGVKVVVGYVQVLSNQTRKFESCCGNGASSACRVAKVLEIPLVVTCIKRSSCFVNLVQAVEDGFGSSLVDFGDKLCFY